MSNLAINDTEDLKFMGKAMAKSGLFDTRKDVAKAITKIQMGNEMNIGPATAMSSIHVVDGQPSVGSHVYSAKVKQSDKYHYKVKKKNDKGCVLEWFEKSPMTNEWEKCGESKFTIKDAEQAGLTHKNNWKSYPEDMCFARAITRGIRTHAPDLMEVGAYVPEELNAGDVESDVSEQQAQEVVNEAEEVQETEFEIQESDNDSEEKSTYKNQSEPSESDSDGSDNSSDGNNESDVSDSGSDLDYLSDKQLKKLNTIGSKFYELQEWNEKTWDDKRPELVSQATDGRTNSSKELIKDEANDLIENLEKQLKFYKNALENYKEDYQLAKKFASKLDGSIGKGTHDELIESINSVVTDDEDESDESDEDNEDQDYDDLEF